MRYDSTFSPDAFSGNIVVVTGGGSGIGRCTAHELSALGAEVVLVGRNSDKLEAVQAEIIEDGGAASYWQADIRDEDRVREMVSEILEQKGAINGLVNNAGGQYPSPLSAIKKKGFDAVVATNLVGGFLMAREIYSQYMVKHGGAIVNILADMWGGMPGMGHSGAARAGMDNFTKTAAFEWGHAGVRVNAVAPGWIMSSGMDTYDAAFRKVIPKFKEAVPCKRMGTESEVNSAICFLLSKGAAFINGATLKIDGGASLGNRVWPLPNARHNDPYHGFHRSDLPEWLTGEDA